MSEPDETGARLLRIGDAARFVGVSQSTLRSWERAGWIAPARTRGNQRLYSTADLDRLTNLRPLVQPQLRQLGLRRAVSRLTPPATRSIEDLAGPRLRTLRVRRGLSLRNVARAAQTSAAHLSAVERGLATPTVALLQRVAASVGVTVIEAFSDGGGEAPAKKLVRRRERRALPGFHGVEIEDLVRFPGAILQVELFTVEPGGGSGGDYHHDGEEAIFVLDGSLLVWLDEVERFDLGAGDTLYFSSEQAHRWQNQGDTPTRLLWVNTPPTF